MTRDIEIKIPVLWMIITLIAGLFIVGVWFGISEYNKRLQDVKILQEQYEQLKGYTEEFIKKQKSLNKTYEDSIKLGKSQVEQLGKTINVVKWRVGEIEKDTAQEINLIINFQFPDTISE